MAIFVQTVRWEHQEKQGPTKRDEDFIPVILRAVMESRMSACLNWKIRHVEHDMMDHAINFLGTRRSGSARPLLHGGA